VSDNNAHTNKGKQMSEYMECPTCGEEFQVADELLGTAMRCPICFQGINPFGGILNTKSYYDDDDRYESSYTREVYDELGYEQGYDY